MLEIHDERIEAVSVSRFVGRLDGTTSGTADEHLIRLSEESGTAKIVLDLSHLEYMSSAGLRVILMAAKRAKASGTALALAAPQPAVRQVLEISGFTSILQIHTTVDEAIQASAS